MTACDAPDGPQPDEDPRACLVETDVLLGDDELSTSVAYSPVDDLLLIGSAHRLSLVQVLPAGGFRRLAHYDGHTDRVYAQWSPDGKLAITGSDDGHVKLIRVQTDPPALVELDSMWLDNGAVYAATFSPDGTSVLTGTAQGRMHLLAVDPDVGTLALRDIEEAHAGKIYAIAWSPDGTRALSTGQDHRLVLHAIDDEIGSLSDITTAAGDEETVPVAWSPDGQRAVLGEWGEQNAILLFDVAKDSLEILDRIDIHDSGSRALAWNGDLIATGDHDHRVHMLSYDESDALLEETDRVEDVGIGVHALSWSPDGNRLARAASQLDRISILERIPCEAPDPTQ